MSDFYSSWGPTSGTLANPSDMVALLCPGSTGAYVSVNGTWTGDILVYGTTDPGAVVQGARIAYKSGIGSSGTSTITGNGLLVKKEFPVLTGGQRVVVQAQANFSGTVAITVLATTASALVGISGPVHTAEEEAIRNSHGFTFTTGIQTVPSGQYLNIIVKNPTTSGVNLFFKRRYFFTDRVGPDAPMTFSQLLNPVDPGLTFAQGSNLQTSPASNPSPNSLCTLAFNVSSTHIDTSPPTSNPVQAIIDNSQPFIIDTERMILPGASIGLYVPGVGTAPYASQIEFLCNWYEEVTP